MYLRLSVCVCCLLGHNREPTKTDEPIEVLPGEWIRVVIRNHVFRWVLESPPGKGEISERIVSRPLKSVRDIRSAVNIFYFIR